MIILDTNVLSELLRGPQADRRVLTWMRGLRETPVTTVITRAELLAGVAVLPDGTRKSQLLAGVERALGVLGDCLPVQAAQAATYAEMIAARRSLGRPLGQLDGLIAAIAKDHDAALATRGVAGFDGLGVKVINPWFDDPESAGERR